MLPSEALNAYLAAHRADREGKYCLSSWRDKYAADLVEAAHAFDVAIYDMAGNERYHLGPTGRPQRKRA